MVPTHVGWVGQPDGEGDVAVPTASLRQPVGLRTWRLVSPPLGRARSAPRVRGSRPVLEPLGRWRTPPCDLLEAVAKHRPVDLLEDVGSYLDDVVGSHAEDLHVERRVEWILQRASPFVTTGRPARTCESGRMCAAIEQLDVLQPAHRAASLVGAEDPFTEGRLVQSLQREPAGVRLLRELILGRCRRVPGTLIAPRRGRRRCGDQPGGPRRSSSARTVGRGPCRSRGSR